MKLPGLAWLELAVGRDHDGMTTYSQRAIFQPRGLAGHAYWRSISPFHGVVFGGMLRNITTAAERASRLAQVPRQPATERGGTLRRVRRRMPTLVIGTPVPSPGGNPHGSSTRQNVLICAPLLAQLPPVSGAPTGGS
jgi:Protein of unknown function (DUF2867)